MGTSAGALSGSLYCAGYSSDEVARELCQTPPIQLLRPNLCFWNGFFLLDCVVERLREILPATFESLDKPFAVGVVNAKGEHQMLNSGPLPEAVAASASIPVIFAPVAVPGNELSPFFDGGCRDRAGLQIWRQEQRKEVPKKQIPHALVHLIARSSPFSGTDDLVASGERKVFVLRTIRSQRNFFSLGNYKQEMMDTYEKLIPSMEQFLEKTSLKVTM